MAVLTAPSTSQPALDEPWVVWAPTLGIRGSGSALSGVQPLGHGAGGAGEAAAARWVARSGTWLWALSPLVDGMR